MKTSALPSTVTVPPSITYTGVLLQDGEARTLPCDVEGHMVPVLILRLQLECRTQNKFQAQQRFAAGQQVQCEAAARRYRKGMRLQVQVPLSDLRFLASNVEHVHLVPDSSNPTEISP